MGGHHTSFAQFSADYVARELRENYMLRKKQEEALNDQEEQLIPQAPGEVGEQAEPSSNSRRRLGQGSSILMKARSAYEVFRDAWFAQKREAGVKVRVHQKEVWGEMRNEFNNLSAEDKDYYKNQAELTIGAARQGRRDRRQPRQVVAPAEPAAELVVAPLAPVALAPEATTGTIVPVFLGQTDPLSLAQRSRPGEQAPILPSELGACCPVSEATMQRWMQGARSFGKVGTKWLRDATKIGGPTKDFPERVNYPKMCSAYCCQNTDPTILALYNELLQRFNQAFKPDTVHQDILLLVEIFVGEQAAKANKFEDVGGLGDPCKSIFCLMLAPTGRAGRFLADQTFLPCEVVQGSASPPDFTGLILKTERHNFEENIAPSSLFQHFLKHQAPALNLVAAEDFAKVLLQQAAGSSQVCVTMRGLQHKMHCKPGDPCLDEFRVLGFDEDSVLLWGSGVS